MTDDREPFREARAAGKAKHHEQRLTRDPVKALRYMLAQYDRVVEVHAHVVMDTPEDRELHDRAIATFREAAEPIRKALASWDATYTAAEVKVLTEAALRLGRAEAGEEITAAFEHMLYNSPDGDEFEHTHPKWEGEPECPACWVQDIRQILAKVSPQGQNAVSEPRTGLPASPSHPQDSQTAREAL